MIGRDAFVLGVSTFCKTAEMDAEDTIAFVELLMSDPRLGVATIKHAKLDPELSAKSDEMEKAAGGIGDYAKWVGRTALNEVTSPLGSLYHSSLGQFNRMPVGGSSMGDVIGTAIKAYGHSGGGGKAQAKTAQQGMPPFNQAQLAWLRSNFGVDPTSGGSRIPGTVGYGWGQAQGMMRPQFVRMAPGGHNVPSGSAQEPAADAPEQFENAFERKDFLAGRDKFLASITPQQKRYYGSQIEQAANEAGRKALEAKRTAVGAGMSPELQKALGQGAGTGSSKFPTALIGPHAKTLDPKYTDKDERAAAAATSARRLYGRGARRFAQAHGRSLGSIAHMTPEQMAAGGYVPAEISKFKMIQKYLAQRDAAAGGQARGVYGSDMSMPAKPQGAPGAAAPTGPSGPAGTTGSVAPASPMSPPPTGEASPEGQPGPLGPPGSTMPTPEATHPAVLAAKEMPSSSPPTERQIGNMPMKSTTDPSVNPGGADYTGPTMSSLPSESIQQSVMQRREKAVGSYSRGHGVSMAAARKQFDPLPGYGQQPATPPPGGAPTPTTSTTGRAATAAATTMRRPVPAAGTPWSATIGGKTTRGVH